MRSKITLCLLVALILSACVPASVNVLSQTPTPDIPMPDLIITSAYVTMVDDHGRCLSEYKFIVTVMNQGNAPASDVILLETNSGHRIQAGNLNSFELMTLAFPATQNGSYEAFADPDNNVAESDETNNSATYHEPTPTPPADCQPPLADILTPIPPQAGDHTPIPLPPPMPEYPELNGVLYADMSRGEIMKINPQNQPIPLFSGFDASISENGKQAIVGSSGDLLLSNLEDHSELNLTNTIERLEVSPQWWAVNSKIVFNSTDWNKMTGPPTYFLSMVDTDGTNYKILAPQPSYSIPAAQMSGESIAYEEYGKPMIYVLNSGARPFSPESFGYKPPKGAIFTSPAWSPDGLLLTWWVSYDSDSSIKFDLILFDPTGAGSYRVVHSYTPQTGSIGVESWLPNPVWSPSGQWIAFQTRSEFNDKDLWVVHQAGAIGNHFDLATNPVWESTSNYLIYAQWSPEPNAYFPASVNIMEVPSSNMQQTILPSGSIPLAWIP